MHVLDFLDKELSIKSEYGILSAKPPHRLIKYDFILGESIEPSTIYW